jgi:cellulose synthase/poly-beta-1,6-N-acetylglucosamine synthase-like glycosyltransferase
MTKTTNDEEPEEDGRAVAPLVLLSAVRNEQETVARTIASVKRQTLRPVEWVIMDNGSTDRTHEILRECVEGCPWIQIGRTPWSPHQGYANKVRALERARAGLQTNGYHYLGVLDGDVELPPDYYATVLGLFAQQKDLGITGGVILDPGEDGPLEMRNNWDVPGGAQVFRRECFETIGGFVPIPEGGEDTIACVSARRGGYRTMVVPELAARHLKPRGFSLGGALKRRWHLGSRDAAMGVDPWFELFKAVRYLCEAPVVVGSAARLAGYWCRTLFGGDRVVPPEVVDHLRFEQRRTLSTLCA